jgi:8-oxo-dGTP pyrophosphatase MutT (NUDIX family)
VGRVAETLYALNRLRWRVSRPITVGVRLILVREGVLVLVKHTYQQHWYLPGGGVGRGESLEQAARREAQEELGARLGTLHLFGAYSNFFEYKSDHVIVFFGRDGAVSRAW